MTDELYHYGVKGMHWGVRRAQRENAKVDKSFQKWKEGAAKRDAAINAGKERNAKLRAYESDKSNKIAKSEYKSANKTYKKALRQNTTYRKGSVKQEVDRDLSRRYLSDAKKVEKQLKTDPTNKALLKEQKYLRNQHDVYRASARNAQKVAANRSRAKASVKRSATVTVKSAVASVALTVGVHAVNSMLGNHQVTRNGQPFRINPNQVRDAHNTYRRANNFRNTYMY